MIFDGGIGTSLLKHNSDFEFVDYLNLEQPDLVINMHREFVNAGCDVITTNSFCCLKSLIDNCGEIAFASAQIAKQVAGDKLVAGSIGPGYEPPTHKDYEKTIQGLVDGECDFLHVESVTEIQQAEIVLEVINGALPVGISFVKAPSVLFDFELKFVGINCGAEPMENELSKLSQITDLPLAYFPAAGSSHDEILPPVEWAKQTAEIASKYNCEYVGGCCGASAEHIEKLIVEII